MNQLKNLVNENMIPAYALEKGDWFTVEKKRVYEVTEIGHHIIRGMDKNDYTITLSPDTMVYLLSKQLQMF